MFTFLTTLMKDNRGGTAIEYGLIASLIVIAMVGALSQLASSTITMWNGVSTTVTSVNSGSTP